MYAYMQFTAFLVALSATAVRGVFAEPAMFERPEASMAAAIADLASTSTPAPADPTVVRAKAPDSPGPPRRCNALRHCKRAEVNCIGTVVATVRLNLRPNSDRRQGAILLAQSVASSLQLQRVLLQI
jgi:hypothetical protein